jgi:hypothetical protein
MNQKDPIGNIIIAVLFILLAIAGFISYKSIDWDVLKKIEQIPLVLPTPIPPANNATTSDIPTATTSAIPTK